MPQRGMTLLRIRAGDRAVTIEELSTQLKGKSASANKRYNSSDLMVAIGRSAVVEDILAIVTDAGYVVLEKRRLRSQAQAPALRRAIPTPSTSLRRAYLADPHEGVLLSVVGSHAYVKPKAKRLPGGLILHALRVGGFFQTKRLLGRRSPERD